ncbi:MAG: HAD hydrolase-like protein [Puniceicoccales bacterium]
MSSHSAAETCLIFDFDGTVANTLDLGREIFNAMADKYGYRPVAPEEVEKLRDLTTSQFVKHQQVPRLKLPAILSEGKRMLAERMEDVRPIEGMDVVLPVLRKHWDVLGILTSNDKVNVRTFLRQHDLDFFDFVSTVPKLSGKAKSLKAIMRTFTLTPAEVCFVGDESRDMKAARKVDVTGAGVLWGANTRKALKLHEPKYILSRPSELLDVTL